MILQISTTEWLMLKDAVVAPYYYKARYTEAAKQALARKLNKVLEEQCHWEVKDGMDTNRQSHA